MKKWTTLIAVATLSLGLAACNETAKPAEKTEVTKKSELTLQEVYDKSIAASEELKSVRAVMDLNQKMNIPNEENELEISSKMDMEYIVEPMQMHQKGTSTVSGLVEGMTDQTSKSESYMTADEFYVYDESTGAGQWMKLPQEMMAGIMNASEQANASDQLKQIQGYLDDFTFEQDNDNYILTLEASGEKFTELVKTQVDEVMQSMGMGEEIQMDFDIHSVNYLIHIDKETFQTNKLDVVFDMDMDIDGEKMNIVQDVKSTFSGFNEVEEIVIPQEVIDKAVEL
ncbi:hypothetical protein OR571_02185 [Psychrobacillus sp. NEAU-3TGS]|uniref:DUF6612 family protein n=1 Tax=Psychrobacillus sp. NEAU-3TGS TaxID=2995412 RepID=UPI002496E47B|nr:DUF6612 family protein [Psychrobacillus sp. NEAU-3TGS]MDI2585970.1 hypothetical protein [Psychrobacillus sp. NEAU-3TGS]